LWSAAAAAAATAWAVKVSVPALHPIAMAVVVLTPYGLVFFAVALALRIPEAASALQRFGRLQS
jgi:hypothetical protein